MEADSWTRMFSASSKRNQSSQQSRYDLYLGFEEIDGSGGDEESRVEFACPFCAEDFDIVGLCCHIDDEHPVEAKNGICPICAARVGMDLIGHITMQHGNFFKTQRRRRFRRGSSTSQSTLSQLSLLRKELKEANLHALLGGLSQSACPSAAPDPLLSSLVYTLPKMDSLRDVQPESSDEGAIASKCSEVKAVESSLLWCFSLQPAAPIIKTVASLQCSSLPCADMQCCLLRVQSPVCLRRSRRREFAGASLFRGLSFLQYSRKSYDQGNPLSFTVAAASPSWL